jgi:hypothetical protein
MKWKRLAVGLMLVVGAGCEREIAIVPNVAGPLLVVDAEIEAGGAPLIFLSKSLGYFNQLDLATLAGSSVSGASVAIASEGRTYTMKAYQLPLGNQTVTYYAPDLTNPAQALIGKVNTSYTLNIELEGKRYTASTTIPRLGRTLDSLWWQPAPNNKDTNRVVAFVRVTDPPGLGNYIRYYTSRNDSGFLPGFNSVFDDAIVDGTTYNVNLPRAQSRNAEFDVDEFGYFRRGDTIEAKLSNIDKATFDFWRTWEASQDANGNPFGSPVKVLGNISNGALGYFGGYASMVRRLVVPK